MAKRRQTISAAQFEEAMCHLTVPGPTIRKLLRAHYMASGRVATMTILAEAAGFANFNPANLHYGALARRIGTHLAISEPTLKLPEASDAYLSLLVDFIRPDTVTNTQWLLVMKPEFATALESSRWLSK